MKITPIRAASKLPGDCLVGEPAPRVSCRCPGERRPIPGQRLGHQGRDVLLAVHPTAFRSRAPPMQLTERAGSQRVNLGRLIIWTERPYLPWSRQERCCGVEPGDAAGGQAAIRCLGHNVRVVPVRLGALHCRQRGCGQRAGGLRVKRRHATRREGKVVRPPGRAGAPQAGRHPRQQTAHGSRRGGPA